MTTKMSTLWGYPATITVEVDGQRIEVDALECTEHHDGPPTRVIVNMTRVIKAIGDAKAEAKADNCPCCRWRDQFKARL